tara:strand:+ start:1187 stop:1402 length:216 start_codon:yes stop_codon:yes gene_type:complete
MAQSKKHSTIETFTNTFTGTAISYCTTVFVLPYWGYNVSWTDGIEISVLFTLLSLIRGYIVRRIFNKGDTK